MANVAIIPARGGSKRIPRKNIKEFHGLPLIAYSIKTAIKSELFDEVYVSTDDEEIAKISKSYDAKIIQRPKELADDFTGTSEVVDDALKSLDEEYDYVCTIYPTAPMLQVEYLKEGLEKLKNSNAVHAFSATSMPFPIQRSFKLDNDGRCEMFTREYYMSRSQDLEEAYHDGGQFYWKKIGKSSDEIMFGRDSIAIMIPRFLVQDIDTLEDWRRAEIMYQTINQNSFDKWNSLKQKIDNKEQIIGYSQRDILFISIGKNVGFESYGKGEEFLRPVLVVKKFGKDSFYGIPLSTNNKEGYFYYNFNYKKDIKSTAMLSQAKVFDSKRIKYRSGQIRKKDFEKLIKKFFEVITPFPDGKGSD